MTPDTEHEKSLPAASLPFHQSYEADDELISPFSLLNVILRYRLLILACVLLATAAALAARTSRTSMYEASVKFVPNPAADNNVAGSRSDPSPQADPADYYTNLLHSSEVLDKVLGRSFQGQSSLKDLLAIRAETPELRMLLARSRVRGAVKLTAPRAGRPGAVLTLSVRWSDPRMAADLANVLVDELAAYDRRIKSATARGKREFIEKQIYDTEALLKRAEEDLRVFKERNRLLAIAESPPPGDRVVVPAELQLARDRRQREVTMQSELYLTLKKEHELARIAENNDGSALVIIERAAVSLSRLGASGRLVVAAGPVVGLFVGVVAAFLLHWWRAGMAMETAEAREFRGHLAALRQDLRKLGNAIHIGALSREPRPAGPETVVQGVDHE
jgi:uncharacterized protein involved in exopolysaccharide biosynthesis